MDEQYINDFFEKGILRLSSFQTYKDYEDIIRGDKGEGSNLAVAQNLEQNRSMGVYTTIGLNSYSLCASLIYSKDLQKVFNCNSVFMIKDVMSYSIAVGDSILRLREIFQGCCSYVDQRITIVEHPDLSLESLRVSPESDNIDMGKMMQKAQEITPLDTYFLKPKAYAYQCEYRFIWNVQGNVGKYLEVECKDAVQFCERLNTQ